MNKNDFKPKTALILYYNDKDSYIESHPINNAGMIGAGSPLKKETILDLLKTTVKQAELELEQPVELLPKGTLINYNITGKKILAWHVPGTYRELIFKFNKNKPYKVIVPDLIFMVKNKDLYVYAIKDAVIKSKTKLYNAPFPNTYGDGRICLGSIKVPKLDTMHETILFYEHAFFNTEFNHTVGDNNNKEWETMIKNKDIIYPAAKLKTRKQTLQQLIDKL